MLFSGLASNLSSLTRPTFSTLALTHSPSLAYYKLRDYARTIVDAPTDQQLTFPRNSNQFATRQEVCIDTCFGGQADEISIAKLVDRLMNGFQSGQEKAGSEVIYCNMSDVNRFLN